jgi:hypothetical protein
MADYQLRESGVLRRADEAHIPDDPANPAWQEYLAWLAAGNTPDPADPAPVEDTERRARRAQMRANAVIQALATSTPAQVDAYVDAQVTDLASARRVIKALAIAVSVLLKEGL